MTPVRPVHDIKRRLLAGEPMTSRQVQDDYDASTSLLGSVVADLRRDGHTISSAKLPREPGNNGGIPSVFTVADVPRETSEWGKGPDVVKLRGARTGPRKAAKETSEQARERKAAYRASHPANGSPLPEQQAKVPAKRKQRSLVPALPQLGADISVCLLAVDDDGRISIGLRSEAGTWLTSVDGFSANGQH